MLRGIVMTENLEGKRESLNNITSNSSSQIDRGVELLIRNKRRKPDPPKTFQVKFGKMVSLFLQRNSIPSEFLSGY